MARRHAHDEAAPIRITTAAEGREADISARQRRYIISMSIRTLCVIGAILAGGGWVRWVLIAGAIVLPYIAVVMANASAPRSDDFSLQPDLSPHLDALPQGHADPSATPPATPASGPDSPG